MEAVAAALPKAVASSGAGAIRRVPRVLVGLGNRGYGGTRHNVGRDLVNFLAAASPALRHKAGAFARRRELRADEAAVEVPGCGRLRLVKPRDPMNANGGTLLRLLRDGCVATDDLLVVHDDMEMPLGRFRFTRGGSAKGHRGVLSCYQSAGTRDFWRLRLGIGRSPRSAGAAAVLDYVLGLFSEEELAAVAEQRRQVMAVFRALHEAEAEAAAAGAEAEGAAVAGVASSVVPGPSQAG